MEKISLQDGFTLKVLGENVYHIPEEEIEAKVPGTVYGTLLDKGLMPDPYFRENELTATKLMENDFEYRKEFFVTEEMTSADGLYLVFEGIDTLSDIYLNEEKIGSRVEVLVEGYDDYIKCYYGRSAADAPDIDGKVFFMAGRRLKTGDYVTVQINDTIEYDLLGELI